MRTELCTALVARSKLPEMVFLTGDLGFMALEPLRDSLGNRFINCGVAEQNMVTVAAGLAKAGFDVWVYSIAPFCYARAFEQIRNDVCLHGLPVRLLGNGGGYGYGVMGPTHHALEDYGVMLTLPACRCMFRPSTRMSLMWWPAPERPMARATSGSGVENCRPRLRHPPMPHGDGSLLGTAQSSS